MKQGANDVKNQDEPGLSWGVKIVRSTPGVVFWRTCRGGGMADATDLKSVDRKVVRVRLPPSAPRFQQLTKTHHFSLNSDNGVDSVDQLIFVNIIDRNCKA